MVVWDLRRWRREKRSEERVVVGRGGVLEEGGAGRRSCWRVRERAVGRAKAESD